MTNSKIWCESGTSPPQNNDLQKTSKFITVHDMRIHLELFDKIASYIKDERKQLFDNQKKIWNVSDVAGFLDCSVKTIYNKTSKGEIPHYKKGKFLYFRPEEIENWLMEGNL